MNSLSWKTIVGLVVGSSLLVTSVLVVGIYVGSSMGGAANGSLTDAAAIRLHAEAANSGKNVSLATGRINNDIEGLFILDHVSGNLQCWVLNERTGTVAGIYRANVYEGLAIGKPSGNPDFVMAAGLFNFASLGSARPADSVCYVAEGNTGKVVGYGLQFDKGSAQRGGVIQGVLSVICQGAIRDLQIRNQ